MLVLPLWLHHLYIIVVRCTSACHRVIHANLSKLLLSLYYHIIILSCRHGKGILVEVILQEQSDGHWHETADASLLITLSSEALQTAQ